MHSGKWMRFLIFLTMVSNLFVRFFKTHFMTRSLNQGFVPNKKTSYIALSIDESLIYSVEIYFK